MLPQGVATAIGMSDISGAVGRVVVGLEKRSRVLSRRNGGWSGIRELHHQLDSASLNDSEQAGLH